jgi:DNA-binding NarL/FixJ family response regulator
MTFAHRTAIVYGDSVFLKGIADILRSLPGVEVIEKQQQGESAFAEIQPSVVLLDAAQISLPQMEVLIHSFPSGHCPPFIRLSADSQRLTIHSMQSLPAVDLADLTQALEKIFNLIS